MSGMWIDDAGVAHTVALPNPTDVMSSEFREALDALAPGDREALGDEVQRWEERLYAAGWQGFAMSSELEGAGPPTALLEGRVQTVGDVEAAVERVDQQWRLDVLVALADYLD